MNHATLEVPRTFMDAEIDWWERVLGFREEEPYSDKYGARWIYRIWALGAPREQIHLFPVPQLLLGPGNQVAPGAETAIIPKYGHLAFVVGDDLDVVVREAAALSPVAPVEGSRYWGTRRFMLTTPATHRVEVMETGPKPADER
jgi:catechol 2,3-dioxygenase-like lactoylglutathione lyase family enzyme